MLSEKHYNTVIKSMIAGAHDAYDEKDNVSEEEVAYYLARTALEGVSGLDMYLTSKGVTNHLGHLADLI